MHALLLTVEQYEYYHSNPIFQNQIIINEPTKSGIASSWGGGKQQGTHGSARKQFTVQEAGFLLPSSPLTVASKQHGISVWSNNSSSSSSSLRSQVQKHNYWITGVFYFSTIVQVFNQLPADSSRINVFQVPIASLGVKLMCTFNWLSILWRIYNQLWWKDCPVVWFTFVFNFKIEKLTKKCLFLQWEETQGKKKKKKKPILKPASIKLNLLSKV